MRSQIDPRAHGFDGVPEPRLVIVCLLLNVGGERRPQSRTHVCRGTSKHDALYAAGPSCTTRISRGIFDLLHRHLRFTRSVKSRDYVHIDHGIGGRPAVTRCRDHRVEMHMCCSPLRVCCRSDITRVRVCEYQWA